MERIQFLIEKLHTQQQSGAATDQMLITVQLLHQELVRSQDLKPRSSGKVSVIMPVVFETALPVVEESYVQPQQKEQKIYSQQEVIHHQAEPLELQQPLQQKQAFNFPDPPVETQPLKEIPKTTSEKAPAFDTYALRKPVQVQPEPVIHQVKEEAPEYFVLPFNVEEETPTLVQQQQRHKEVHELIGETKASLNDKLKQEKTELVHVLKDAPIKDLRKGIGVNDKFLFINELFRGDEAMYERSIKTINGFHILPEAEYWINRELKVKLGWNDINDTVQYFYQVVRRRFA